jgi:hypothetical protein
MRERYVRLAPAALALALAVTVIATAATYRRLSGLQ